MVSFPQWHQQLLLDLSWNILESLLLSCRWNRQTLKCRYNIQRVINFMKQKKQGKIIAFWKRIGMTISTKLINGLKWWGYTWTETSVVKRCQPCKDMEEDRPVVKDSWRASIPRVKWTGKSWMSWGQSWRTLQSRVRSSEKYELGLWSFALLTEGPLGLLSSLETAAIWANGTQDTWAISIPA